VTVTVTGRGDYDGSVPRELMGDLSPEEELAYLTARNLYLETVIEAQKKLPLTSAGTPTSSRRGTSAPTPSSSQTAW